MLSTAHKIIRDDFDYILDGKEIEFDNFWGSKTEFPNGA